MVRCFNGEQRQLLGMIHNNYLGSRIFHPIIQFIQIHAFSIFSHGQICQLAGLTSHPEVLASAGSALEQFGSGTSSSRLLGGTTSLHKELEEKLAKFLDKEACLLFTSGFTANLGLFQTILGPGDAIFSDQYNHASLIDGIR